MFGKNRYRVISKTRREVALYSLMRVRQGSESAEFDVSVEKNTLWIRITPSAFLGGTPIYWELIECPQEFLQAVRAAHELCFKAEEGTSFGFITSKNLSGAFVLKGKTKETRKIALSLEVPRNGEPTNPIRVWIEFLSLEAANLKTIITDHFKEGD